jgi:hypothetical protein
VVTVTDNTVDVNVLVSVAVVVVVIKELTVTVLVDTIVSTRVEVIVNVTEITGGGVPLVGTGVQAEQVAPNDTLINKKKIIAEKTEGKNDGFISFSLFLSRKVLWKLVAWILKL